MKSFTLNGKPMPPAPLSLKRVLAFLDGKAADELFDSRELANQLQSTQEQLRHLFLDEKAKAYTTLASSKKRFWGNPKAIAEWNRRAKECNED
jgi:hypothetical protein